MKFELLGLMLIVCNNTFGQNGNYIQAGGDTVYCEIKKVFPRSVQVEVNGKTKTLKADEIAGFTLNGVFFEAKNVKNKKKYNYIFFPDDKMDRKYLYRDPVLNMISAKGVTFYKLTEFVMDTRGYGRSSEITLYIENDSLGLSEIPYLKAFGGNDAKEEVIKVLYEYLKADEAIAKRLTVNEQAKAFRLKGIEQLIYEFTGKEFVE